MMDEDEDGSRTGNQSQKKRSRRVSFSDVTSVHFFEKDDETPPEIKRTPTPQKLVKDFFGPVSLWHLKSASGESPLENDVTLDATEFSQNLMKLLRSCSQNLTQFGNTPTGESLEVSPGKSMTLTGNVPKPNLQSVPIQTAVDKKNAGDMSLTGEHDYEYNFGSISPHLVTMMRNADTPNRTVFSKPNRSLEQVNDGLKPKRPVNESYTEGTSAGCSAIGSGINLGVLVDYNLRSPLGMSHEMNQWDHIDLNDDKHASLNKNDDHKLSNSVSSSMTLNHFDGQSPVSTKKINISDSGYLLQSTNAELKHCHKNPRLAINEIVQDVRCSPPKNNDVSLLLDDLSICAMNNFETSDDHQFGRSENPTGNILKLKNDQTGENLLSVEPSTALVPSSSNAKDPRILIERREKVLKDGNINHVNTIELKDQDKGTSLERDIQADKNFNVIHNLIDIAGSYTPDRTISLVRPILAPLSLNSEDMRTSNTFSKSRIPEKGVLAAESDTLNHEQQQEDFVKGQCLKGSASEQPLVFVFTQDEKDSIHKFSPSKQRLETRWETQIEEEVPRKFFVGVHEFCLPVIAKPRTLQECLRFMYGTRPQVCLLEETVKQLQKDVANFNTLSSTKRQIMHAKNLQSVDENSLIPEHLRIGHIKWLQQMLAYEKSKCQLLLAKRDELKTKIQKLQLESQEVDKLKAKAFCVDKKLMFKKDDECSIHEAATKGKEAYIKLLEVDIEKQMKLFASNMVDSDRISKEIQKENQDTYEKVIIMKQELDVLDYKIRDLCEFYCAFCSRKDNVSMNNGVQFIEDYVKSMTKNSLILQDMLLWKLKDVKSKPGDHFIELNYLDIISQRFTIAGDGPLAKASTSYNISYKSVERVFPFMNASRVFSAVFASKKNLKTVDVGSIWQTIQEMRFLFGTLIDVLQEIQLCCTKLQNLSFARFHSVDGSDLQLQLTFLKYTCGLKVVVSLDMQNVKYGIYPSDVLPIQVELVQHGQQSECLLAAAEIEESVKSLAPGYSRLTMLCDCISNLIECVIRDTCKTLS